jgi:peptide/nickel transport system permease protein
VALYLLRRLGFILLTILVVSVLIFIITRMMPGDVARVMLGQFATDQAVENLREELGLNRPAYVQYLDWLANFVRGDWGTSLVNRLEVRGMVMERLENSLRLALMSLAIYVPLGILLGVVAALQEDKLADQAISGLSMAFAGLPEFVTGVVLVSYVAISWRLLPANSSIDPDTTFREALSYMILPAITVSLTSLGYIARMTRASTIDVLRQDYVRAAELKGLPRRQVLIRHVLRNSLLPTVTVVAMGIGWLIGGLIVTESVYGYPGVGRLLVYGIQRRDLILVQATTMVIVTVFTLSNFAADILYGVLNPRIRLSE